MGRTKEPEDQPDAVLMTNDDNRWEVFCVLCPRTLHGSTPLRSEARWVASEHLEFSHGLKRVWIDSFRPGYRNIVQMALPLIVAHDLTLATDPLGR